MNDSSFASRRTFLKEAALASGAVVSAGASQPKAATRPQKQPNILMICADQFRADFVGAARENPSVKTPHIDALAQRGTYFRQAVCNQPLCSPSRASFLTGVHATGTKVWKLGVELDHGLPTVASTLKNDGYTTAFIGKWHVSSNTDAQGKLQQGWIPPGPSRGGFDSWEGANVIEIVSHPYEGSYWNNEGTDIGFKDVYRVDFITDRSVAFLEQKHEKPWLLFVSQLEPHHQNDVDQFVPPKRYANTYDNPFVPHDLRDLPGNWSSRLPGYYGDVQAIDDCVGKLVDTLQRTGQLENTVIVFFSDHGCTFRTRIGEYKRSPHESSLRVPFVVAGPGFDRSMVVDELISLLDLTPTLIDAAGSKVPATMKGKSLRPLVENPAARKQWDSRVYIQISQSICGRAIRTQEWTYCAHDPKVSHGEAEGSTTYTDFALYSLLADPYQKVNLIGREGYKDIAADLRKQLIEMIVQNGEPRPEIAPALFYA
jgi:arylsulfatase A-like enzyme